MYIFCYLIIATRIYQLVFIITLHNAALIYAVQAQVTVK